MNDIQRILVPYNFTIPAEKGFEYAMSFAKTNMNSKLDLLYIESGDESAMDHEKIENQFKELIERASKKTRLDINYHIKIGSFSENVIEAQEELKADIIIVGTKGSSNPDSQRITNTADLVVKADCPVMVIPENFEEFEIKEITLAVGKNEIDDPKALKTLLAVARRFDAHVHVLTIYNEGDEDILKDTVNEEMLHYYLDRYYTRSSMAISSNIADSIVAYDKKEGIDMLAIIPRNHPTNGKPSEGRLTKFLTMNTDIPLLTID